MERTVPEIFCCHPIGYMSGLHAYRTIIVKLRMDVLINPSGCLYIDGELGEKEMEERVSHWPVRRSEVKQADY